MKAALFTAIETPFARKLANLFTAEGYQVAEADTPNPIDFFIDTTDIRLPDDHFSITDGINAALIEKCFRDNVLHSMQLLEKFLPNLDAGEGKRLFYLSNTGASLNQTRDTRHYAYNMAKASLHQFLQLISNQLSTKGYTFRIFDPLNGEIAPENAAGAAFHYLTRRRGTENHDPRRDDENNLILRDALGRAWHW